MGPYAVTNIKLGLQTLPRSFILILVSICQSVVKLVPVYEYVRQRSSPYAFFVQFQLIFGACPLCKGRHRFLPNLIILVKMYTKVWFKKITREEPALYVELAPGIYIHMQSAVPYMQRLLIEAK